MGVAAANDRLPDTIGLKDLADFVVATRNGGANVIGLGHSLGYTRGILNALHFSEGSRIASMLHYALLGDSPKPPAVPPELTAAQRRWVRWRVGLLGGHIRLVAPLAPVLLLMGERAHRFGHWDRLQYCC